MARSGAVAVLAAEMTTLPQTEMVAIGASTLAHGQPDETLLVPADQPLLLRGARAELLYGQSPVVLPRGGSWTGSSRGFCRWKTSISSR